MREIVLIKNGELALKGLNRSSFEDVLIKNMRRHLAPLGTFQFTKSQSTIMVEPEDPDTDLDDTVDALTRVFGIAALSRAAVCEKDIEDIAATALEYLKEPLEDAKTFKVEAKRSDKKFPMKSPEICREMGGRILRRFHHLKVDVHNPDITVTVEVRDRYAFVRGNNLHGAGGMPTGTGGRAAVLISGGIDSPVASYMMAKRGIELVAVHFASPPYTSELAEMKVMELLKKVARYSGWITTFVVPVYGNPGADSGQVPGGILYHYHAPRDDDDQRPHCKESELPCPDYRRIRRAGSQPDHVRPGVHGLRSGYAGVPSLYRYGQGRDHRHLPQDRHL